MLRRYRARARVRRALGVHRLAVGSTEQQELYYPLYTEGQQELYYYYPLPSAALSSRSSRTPPSVGGRVSVRVRVRVGMG